MDIKEQFLARRTARMFERKVEIDDERKKLSASVKKIVPHFLSLKADGDYIGYILLGTSLIERQLVTAVKAHIHAFELLSTFSDISTSKAFPYEFGLKVREKLTAGQAMKQLVDLFGFAQNHSKLYERTKEVIDLRNNLSHRLVDEFEGDIALANSELKGVAEKEIVENVFNALTELLNAMARDLEERLIRTKAAFETKQSSAEEPPLPS